MCRWWTRRSCMDKSTLNLEIGKNKIGIISIDQPNTGANVMNENFFHELTNILEDISTQKLNGLIFISKKPKVFLAGADLQAMQSSIGDDDKLRQLIEYGQKTFNDIQALPFPTVAAIHGVCLGGGLELSLACDYRIASSEAATKIGLPEVMLGILPAWGGCTRLPRLIGLIKALNFILAGRPYNSKYCKKLGIVDAITYKDQLISKSIELINKGTREKKKDLISTLCSPIISQFAKKATLRKTKGNYPAPLKIINVVSKGIKTSKDKSLLLEKDAFIELVNTDVCRNLIRIFFLQESAKKLKHGDFNNRKVSKAVIIGSGTMGGGIAQWLASRNINVLIKDISIEQLSAGLKNIGNLFVKGVLKYKFDRPAARKSISNISVTTDDVTLKDRDILIEAIAEDFNIKTKVLRQLEKKCSEDTIIATNTSAISISELAGKMQRPEKFIGIHFFNPVHQMKLVEIVVGKQTSQETVSCAVEFVKSIGKLPVVVKDSPGFLVNRILLPYLVESIRILGIVGDVERIDKLMVKFGMPMGPFRLLDEIGLDVAVHVASDLADRLDDFNMPGNFDTIMVNKEFGKKTGAGFYTYNKGKRVEVNNNLVSQLQLSIEKEYTDEKIVNELAQVMVDEANKCLYEGIVDSSDILDFAMIMGTGWAPFRGGPIQFSKK